MPNCLSCSVAWCPYIWEPCIYPTAQLNGISSETASRLSQGSRPHGSSCDKIKSKSLQTVTLPLNFLERKDGAIVGENRRSPPGHPTAISTCIFRLHLLLPYPSATVSPHSRLHCVTIPLFVPFDPPWITWQRTSTLGFLSFLQNHPFPAGSLQTALAVMFSVSRDKATFWF